MASFDFSVIDSDSGTIYFPWTDGSAVGFKACHANGDCEFIYLNPSTGSDDAVPNVFVYMGTAGALGEDEPVHHYVLNDPAT